MLGDVVVSRDGAFGIPSADEPCVFTDQAMVVIDADGVVGFVDFHTAPAILLWNGVAVGVDGDKS